MSYDFLKIQYENFSPKWDQKQLALAVMRNIEFAAPSDSCVRFDVTKADQGYRGRCRVTSASGVFAAESEATSLEALVVDIEGVIHDQLNSWKATRFRNTSDPSPTLASAS